MNTNITTVEAAEEVYVPGAEETLEECFTDAGIYNVSIRGNKREGTYSVKFNGLTMAEVCDLALIPGLADLIS